jgi:hypothetical protein
MLRVAAAVAGVVVASLMSASAFAQTRPPRVSISGDLGRLFFDVRCAQVAQVPVTIALRGPRNRTFKLDRPCGTWTASSAAMPNVAPRTISRHDTAAEDFLTEPDLVSRLELTATGSRTIRRVYDYTVKVDGVTQTAGKIIVRNIARRIQRVFQGTDAFQNYCRNRGRRIFSSGGLLYCTRPAGVSRLIYTNKQ